MAENRNFQYGLLLVQQRRYREAEQEFRRELARSPENAFAHAMLAAALTAQEKNAEAVDEARRSVGLAPYQPHGHYILAMTLFHTDCNQEALLAIQEALRLDSEDEQYYELQGKIYAALGDWERALESARSGLKVNAQDVDCANLEAIALVHLGRQSEASSVIETALHKDPENATTHANLGWADLHAGNYQNALLHFRNALRLNPNLEWARQGVIEAMKARSILYQPILRYFLWMERLPAQVRWGVIVGLVVLIRALRQAARFIPALEPVILPVLGLYLLFAFMTWIARPLFNLFLRLDRFGRMALSQDEITASNWLGLCVFGGLGVMAASLLINSGFITLIGIGLTAMSIPVAGVFQAKSQRARQILTVYTIALALVGLLGAGAAFWDVGIGGIFGAIFLIGWVLYSWIGNFLISRK